MEKKRVLLVYFGFFLVFVLILGRLYQIQFIDGPGYARQAAVQRQRTVNLVPYPRGQILDHNLRPLTNTEKQPCLVVFPLMVKDVSDTGQVLSRLLNIPASVMAAKLESGEGGDQVVRAPFMLKGNLTEEEISLIKKADLPGIYVLPLVPRYQAGSPAVHLIGYVAGLNPEEYSRLKAENKGYDPGDVIGKSGLEKQYEAYLRGGTSERVAALVDDRGRLLAGRGFTLLPPVSGNVSEAHQLVLTIDRDVQTVAEEELKGQSGAAVVMDVENGDILALASSPQFDPDMLESPQTDDAYINKAVQNYPPASVFKILIAAAALEEGLVKPEDYFTCTGGITIPGGRTVSCWNKTGHGEITFAQALAFSCNPVFVETGLKLGGERIIKYAERFGLIDDTIIGYNIAEQRQINFHPTVPGDIANVSIGENGVSLSPVLVAKLVSQVVNGGHAVTPRVVREIRDSQGRVVKEFPAPPPVRVVRPEVAETVRKMLETAVEEGTGQPAQVPGLTVGGKTGSSESQEVWFAGFAPGNAPRWAIVVFIQKGVSGGKAAAPVFRNIVSRLSE